MENLQNETTQISQLSENKNSADVSKENNKFIWSWNPKKNGILRYIIIAIALFLDFVLRFIPAPQGMSQDAFGVIGIFAGSLLLWLTLSIDWPSILCLFALSLLNNLSFNSVFVSSFGNSTFTFLMFTFICTYALTKTPLIKRIAIWFIDNKLAKKSGWAFSILFLLSSLILGCFISPSVLFMIMMPILEQILQIAKIEKGEKVGNMLYMGLAFAISISSGMTPIAHVFPILAMNAAKITVSYFAYMAFAVPVGLISFVLMILMFRFIMHPDMSKLTNLDISSMKSEMKKISKKEIWSLSIFIFVILLWIIPSFFQHISPSFYSFINNYGTAMPPMLGVILLCIVRVDGEQLVSIPDAMKNGIPWASLIMCAGTLALGSAMTDKTIGLKSYLQNSMSSALSGISPIVLLIIFGLWAMLQTNVSSNMVTATLVSTVATGILNSMPTSELSLAAVVCMIGMLSAYAFATPPSMPHIAITCSSGYSNTSSVLKYGSLLMVLSLIVSLCIGYPLACLFM